MAFTAPRARSSFTISRMKSSRSVSGLAVGVSDIGPGTPSEGHGGRGSLLDFERNVILPPLSSAGAAFTAAGKMRWVEDVGWGWAVLASPAPSTALAGLSVPLLGGPLMRSPIRLACALALVLAPSLSLAAPETFNLEVARKIVGVGSPRVSPDGRSIAFIVSKPNF